MKQVLPITGGGTGTVPADLSDYLTKTDATSDFVLKADNTAAMVPDDSELILATQIFGG